MGRTTVHWITLGMVLMTTQGAWPIEPLTLDGTAVEGRLEEGDREWLPPHDPASSDDFFRDVYEISLQANETIDIYLEAEFDAILTFYTDRSRRLAVSDDHSHQFDSRIAISPPDAGRYLVVVTTYLPGGMGAYRLTARSLGVGAPLPEDYVPNAPAQSGMPDLLLGPSGDPVEGTVTNGAIEAGEMPPLPPGLEDWEEIDPSLPRDIYPLEAEVDTVITVDLRARFNGLLCLTTPGGELHASNDDYSRMTHSRMGAVPITETGTWHITVAPSPLGEVGGTYTLTITDPEPSPGFSADTPITPGQTIAGELTSGDRAEFWAISERVPFAYHRDGFVFEGVAGQDVQVDVTDDFQMKLYLLDPNGIEIGYADDWQTLGSAQLRATLAETGPHRLVITTLSAETAGSYTLSLRAGGN